MWVPTTSRIVALIPGMGLAYPKLTEVRSDVAASTTSVHMILIQENDSHVRR